MTALKIGLQVVLVIASLLLTLLVLLHKGKGGGLSDMFVGGVTSSVGGSSIAERNLDRFTVALGLVWLAAIVAGCVIAVKYQMWRIERVDTAPAPLRTPGGVVAGARRS